MGTEGFAKQSVYSAFQTPGVGIPNYRFVHVRSAGEALSFCSNPVLTIYQEC